MAFRAIVFTYAIAARNPIGPATFGVPAPYLSAACSYCADSTSTSCAMLDPSWYGGIASSSSRRAHSTPTPIGPSILWLENARKSQSSARTSTRTCRDRLRRVDQHAGAGAMRARAEFDDRIEITDDR